MKWKKKEEFTKAIKYLSSVGRNLHVDTVVFLEYKSISHQTKIPPLWILPKSHLSMTKIPPLLYPGTVRQNPTLAYHWCWGKGGILAYQGGILAKWRGGKIERWEIDLIPFFIQWIRKRHAFPFVMRINYTYHNEKKNIVKLCR